jgi:hypothetical protein
MARKKTRSRHKCPHCKGEAIIYTSHVITELVTEEYVQCVDLACDFKFVVSVGVVRALSPSLAPDPAISIPLIARRPNDIVVERAPGGDNQLATHAHVPTKGKRTTASTHSAH